MSSPSASFVPAPGAAPLPDYELKALLGRGGFGEVWRATGPGGFDVAIKFVRLEGKAGDVERRALETIKGLRHAHLLPVFGAWERDGFLIMAMELGDKSLMDRFEECHAAKQRGIPREELLGYLRDAARGLDYLGEARPGADGKMTFLQHRDVKPQNLMLVGGTVKIADFGLIKVLKHTLTNASSKMTLTYAPPELFGEKLTRWSDQYSLAVSYCLLRGGRMPFNGNAAQLTIGHLQRPPDLSMLPEAERPTVARALEKEPEKRWPNCTVFAESLATVQRPPSKSDVAPPPPLPDPPALPTWVPAAGEETKHPERHGTDDRPPIDDTLSTMHRPLSPTKKPPRSKQRTNRRSIPWEVWLGVGGVVLVIATLLAAPSILRSWRGNTPSTEMARKSDPPPLIDPKKDKAPPVEPLIDPMKDKAPLVEPRPAPALRLRVPPQLSIKAGDVVPLNVQVERTNCLGPVTLRMERLVAGLTATATTIDAGKSGVTLDLAADSAMTTGEHSVRVVAEADGVKTTADVRVIVEKKQPATPKTDAPLGMKFVKLSKGTFYMGWDGPGQTR